MRPLIDGPGPDHDPYLLDLEAGGGRYHRRSHDYEPPAWVIAHRVRWNKLVAIPDAQDARGEHVRLCWPWLGKVTRQGRAVFYVEKRYVPIREFAYRKMVGEVPDQMFVRPLCLQPLCVNHHHLELTALRGVQPVFQPGGRHEWELCVFRYHYKDSISSLARRYKCSPRVITRALAALERDQAETVARVRRGDVTTSHLMEPGFCIGPAQVGRRRNPLDRRTGAVVANTRL